MKIVSRHGNVLFETAARNFKDAVEEAVRLKIDLATSNLSNMDLRHANLDGAKLRGSLFSNTDLSGANMSECDLRESSFEHCLLYDTCLAESNLSKARLVECRYGDTDFAWACLNGVTISGDQLAVIDLSSATDIKNARYLWRNQVIPISRTSLNKYLLKGQEHSNFDAKILPDSSPDYIHKQGG